MKKQKTNWVLTIVLILGTLTVFFPLYMAVIIAFKKPSEMTNDVAGALSFPSKWSFSNFTDLHPYHFCKSGMRLTQCSAPGRPLSMT